MSTFIAMIRDDRRVGVRVDRVDGWDRCPNDPLWTRVHLSGGGVVDLALSRDEFVQRLDRALTAMAKADG